MVNLLETFEEQQKQALPYLDKFDQFSSGDTVVVKVKIGDRAQDYQGVCLAVKNRGLNSSFTVRKISYGEGVERVFPFYSPNVESVKVLKRGAVRRAKIYYLRDRSGKSARITEARSGFKMKLNTKK